MNILDEIIASSWLPDKDETLELFHKNAADKKYEDWDWKWDWLNLAATLADNQKHFDIVIAFLEKQEENGVMEYHLVEILNIKSILFKKFKTEKECDELLYEYSAHWSVFNRLLEMEFNKENFQQVKKLAFERIKNEKNGIDSSAIWEGWILKVAIAQNDVPEILQIAERDFFKYPNGRKQSFALLNQYIPADRWQQKKKEIISILEEKDAKNTFPYGFDTFLPEFYLSENQLDKLLHWLTKHLSFNTLKQYDEVLKEQFSSELISLYLFEIKRFLEKNTGRDYYIECCRMIRRMKKIGGATEVEKLIPELKIQYKMRPALMQELNKI